MTHTFTVGRSLLLASAILIAAPRTAMASPAFSSAEGGFTVAFPSTPHLKVSQLDASGTKVALHLYTGELPAGTLLVGYVDYPDSGGMTPATRLQQIVDAQVKAQATTVLFRKTCALGSVPCRTASYTSKTATGALLLTLRDYLVGNRWYQISLITTPRDMTPAQIKVVLDSFALTTKATNPTKPATPKH